MTFIKGPPSVYRKWKRANPSVLATNSFNDVGHIVVDNGKPFIDTWMFNEWTVTMLYPDDVTWDRYVENYQDPVTALYADNDLVYYADSICFRVAHRTPAFERVGAECDADDPNASYHNLWAQGDYVYATGGGGAALHTFNVSDPTTPVEASKVTFSDGQFPYSLTGGGDYLYVGRGSNLTIMDISNPGSPVTVGNVSTPADVEGIAVYGDRAYVAIRDEALGIIDISDPSHPVFLQTVSAGDLGAAAQDGNALDVALSPDGRYAYVPDYWQGLIVYQVAE